MYALKKRRGFTLIEILIAVAIVGILAAIALPSYQNHLKKGRRAAAQAVLLDLANRQQQYLLDARGYALGANFNTTLGLPTANITSDFTTYYTLSITPAAATSPPTFTITATPKAGTPQASDGNLTIDNTGAKTYNGAAGW